MVFLRKTIFTGFAPNLTGRDTLIALSYLILPWRWPYLRKGSFIDKAESKIKNYFSSKHAAVFDSGRSALYFALKALGAESGVDVLVQAYTCVVVANAINWTGARPIYIDVDDDFNMDPADAVKKITSRTKIIIIQHTFGQPARMKELVALAKKYQIKIIEDCAHSIGAKYQGRLTGTFGDIGMLSFGTDKAISCVRGGALITNNDNLNALLKIDQENLPAAIISLTLQNLSHYLIFYISKPLYNLFIGKIFLILAKKIRLFSKIITPAEKRGEREKFYPARLPNALAHILCQQLDEINQINIERRKLTDFYLNNIYNQSIRMPKLNRGEEVDFFYLRLPILIDKPKKLLNYAKQNNIILGDWYNAPIAPADIDLTKTGYQPGSCPRAELLASQSVNLPIDRQLTMADAARVVAVINSYKD